MNIELANHIKPFAGLVRKDGNVSVVHVPARTRDGTARQARVTVTRLAGKAPLPPVVLCQCRCLPVDGDAAEGTPCDSEKGGYLCYHCLAAVSVVAESTGGKVWFYGRKREQDARDVAKEKGGRFVAVRVDGAPTESGIVAVYMPPTPEPFERAQPIAVQQDTSLLSAEVERLKRELERSKCKCGKPLLTPAQYEAGLCGVCSPTPPKKEKKKRR